MRNSVIVLFIITLISVASCRSDFEFEPSVGNLGFSKDTVYLDTVFTNIGSSTYTLKVYNKGGNNISIPEIKLGKGNDSKYRITVDGMTGEDEDNNGIGDNKLFKNVELLAKDSLFIFIETTVDIAQANPTDFLYTDQILFGEGTNFQKVELVTLIQDAYFIFPAKNGDEYEYVDFGIDKDGNTEQVAGRNLVENHPINGNEYIWGNTKPYVVYGFASVPDGRTLNINAGARIHFHAGSGIIVQDGGSLKVNGEKSDTPELEKEVIFEGDRLEPDFAEVPGQWYSVRLRPGSQDHSINYLTLKNATNGLEVLNNANEMTINNSQIYNNTIFGLYAQAANVRANNLVVGNCGLVSVACVVGGIYNFTHCTINNSWSSPSSYALLLNNYVDTTPPQAIPVVQANFNNCIIYGSNQNQFFLDKNDGADFNYKFTNCLMKLIDSANRFRDNELYDFTNASLYENCLIEKTFRQYDPYFLNANRNELQIGDESAAKGTANFTDFSIGTFDILGNPRTNPSDIGAYNFTVFKEN